MNNVTVVTLIQFSGNDARTVFDPQVFFDREDADEFVAKSFDDNDEWEMEWENTNPVKNASDEAFGRVALFRHKVETTHYVRVYVKVKDPSSEYKEFEILQDLDLK